MNPHDESIAARVEGIIDKVLDYAEDVMRSGSPKTKNDFIVRVLPTLAKSLQTEEVDTDIERLKANQERIFAALQDAVPGEDVMVPRPAVPDVPIDHP